MSNVAPHAIIETKFGEIELEFFADKAPGHVKNFLDLARKGTYDGTLFHRVIPGFMIQGGDPGTKDTKAPRHTHGTGGPGYRFEDEFKSGRRFDKPGLLAMANAGPNTNGSQFFITVVPTPHLNNRHTIFGEVVQGYEVVDRIANELPKDRGDRPTTEVRINKLTISTTAP